MHVRTHLKVSERPSACHTSLNFRKLLNFLNNKYIKNYKYIIVNKYIINNKFGLNKKQFGVLTTLGRCYYPLSIQKKTNFYIL